MAIWMELRCELRGDGRRESDDRCLSDDNTGPHGMALDSCRSASLSATELFEEAKIDGWKRTKEGWVCPNCLNHAAKNNI